jgi:hypothetical protein
MLLNTQAMLIQTSRDVQLNALINILESGIDLPTET